MHLLFLVVYVLILVGDAELLNSSFSLDSSNTWIAELLLFGWLLFIVGFSWLLVAAMLIRWWRQERQRLVQRTLAWDSLLWLGVFLWFLVQSPRTRSMLIPPPNGS